MDILKEVKKALSLTEKDECLRQIQNILVDYGKESDIPNNHRYWDLKNQYRALR